jgi:hypothetical protein
VTSGDIQRQPWTYGAEGAAYPVEPGQTWACGEQRFTCGSLFDYRPDRPPYLVYADPPWNQGNLASFHTKAGLDRPAHTWLDVYRRIIELAQGAPCFIEGGQRQAEQVGALCLAAPVYRCWPITYYGRHPAVLHYCGPSLLPPGLELAGLDDDDTPKMILAAYPPWEADVLDPCAGRGTTSRAAAAMGWSSVNIEIHPRRMSAALFRLAAQTGDQPRRLT